MTVDTTNFAIAPMTPVFFGDGRPLDAGETDFGKGRFPPPPRTIQGVVRTALLRGVDGLDLGPRVDKARIRRLVGDPSRLPDGWQIAGPWLGEWHEPDESAAAQNVRVWLPAPLHLVSKRDGGTAWVRAVEPRDPSVEEAQRDSFRFKSDIALDQLELPVGPVGQGKSHGGWLPSEQVARIVRGALPTRAPLPLPPFVEPEPHTGLRIVPETRTASDGMLYTRDFYRFREHSGLVGTFRGALDSSLDPASVTRGVTSLGGKNRTARLLEVSSWDEAFQQLLDGSLLPTEPADGARFWVWTTTPVHVRAPLDPGLHNLGLDVPSVRVLSSALGKPTYIGGFSMVRGAGSVARAYLPAGSAWLIELTGGTPQARGDVLQAINNHCVLGDDESDKAFGFGHALVALQGAIS